MTGRPMFWRVHWTEYEYRQSAWFETTRRRGAPPDDGQELVNAEAYDEKRHLANRLEHAIKQHRASRANRQATEKSLADADQELYAALGETAAA